MVEEARLEAVGSGLAPVSEGWFVVNARDAAWMTSDRFGSNCMFEGDEFFFRDRAELEGHEFPQLGVVLRVVWPGQSIGFFHAETIQEDFLVLRGDCVLVVEGEERRLRAWDFVHCPPGTEHVFVGTGEGPCAILATGARTGDWTVVYRRSELALRHGAGVEAETRSGAEAYAGKQDWRPERPARWGELPWADGPMP